MAQTTSPTPVTLAAMLMEHVTFWQSLRRRSCHEAIKKLNEQEEMIWRKNVIKF